jgi:hypothetical protein
MVVALVFAIVAALAALVAAALDPSWPRQVRWTVRASDFGLGGPAPGVCPPPDWREVALWSTAVREDGFELQVLEAGRRPREALTYASATVPALEVRSMLEEWHELRTPMLLHIDAAGVASLSGPVATVTDLRPVATLDDRGPGSKSRRTEEA